MNREQHQKVTPGHLKRAALLCVRQSTMRQVFENTESTTRQYALRDRAVALGWPRDEIVVVDGDLGHTATAAGELPAQPTRARPPKSREWSIPGHCEAGQQRMADPRSPWPWLQYGRAG